MTARTGVARIPRSWLDAVEPLPAWLEPARLDDHLSTQNRSRLHPMRHPLPIAVPKLTFSTGQLQQIRHGVRAADMDEKWNIYLDDAHLYLHRSWTGLCMYMLELADTGDGGARPVACWADGEHQTRHTTRTAEADAALVECLLHSFFKRGRNEEQWQRYLRLLAEDRR